MILKHPDADRNQDSNDAPLVLGSHEELKSENRSQRSAIIAVTLVNLLTILWLGLVTVYVHKNIGWPNLWNLLPHEIGAFFAGAFTPVAFLWLLLANIKRNRENRLTGRALDSLMKDLGYPSPEAEARVASLTLSLRRQSREVQAETENAATRIGDASSNLERQSEKAEDAAKQLLSNADHFQGEMDRRLKIVEALITEGGKQKGEIDGIMVEQAALFSNALKEATEKGESLKSALSEQVEALEEAVGS
ncbi:MAG: hypothetical protein MI743_00835, partial [Sneathiellales bacterium]|nr:hypothetical protein [Sneathiellales bacterium]